MCFCHAVSNARRLKSEILIICNMQYKKVYRNLWWVWENMMFGNNFRACLTELLINCFTVGIVIKIIWISFVASFLSCYTE